MRDMRNETFAEPFNQALTVSLNEYEMSKSTDYIQRICTFTFVMISRCSLFQH